METQSVYCIPEEDGKMKVVVRKVHFVHLFSIVFPGSLQWVALVQQFVANILGRSSKDITVEARSAGGAYGAKITR